MAVSGTGALNLSSGGNFTVARLTVAGGTLGGSAAVTVTEAMTWTGGTLAGSGSTVSLGSLVIDGTNTKQLDGWRLENRGSGMWRGTGQLWVFNGAIVQNAANVVEPEQCPTIPPESRPAFI